MDIQSVTLEVYEDQVEAFIVNGDCFIANGQDVDGVAEVRQWLSDNNQPVPEYSSVRI